MISTLSTSDRFTAKVHEIATTWTVANTRDVVIGPEPRLALAVRARRDAEFRRLFVSYPEFAQPEKIGLVAYGVVLTVPHVSGQRRIKATGDTRIVWGQEDIAAAAMMPGGKPEDLATEPSAIQWWGGLTQWPLDINYNIAPCDYWCYPQRILIPKSCSLGVIVRCDQPTICRAKMAGV